MILLKFDRNRPPAACRKPAPVAVSETAMRLDRLERAGVNIGAIEFLIQRKEERLAERAAAR